MEICSDELLWIEAKDQLPTYNAIVLGKTKENRRRTCFYGIDKQWHCNWTKEILEIEIYKWHYVNKRYFR